MDQNGVLVVDDHVTEAQTADDQPTDMDTIRVLLVDDHAMVIAGLASVIGGQDGIEVVGQADSGEAALAMAEELRPDVMVLDYRMTGMDGPLVAKAVKDAGLPCKLLMLSMYENVHYVVQAMDAGAQGYVKKSAVADELVHAVRTVFEGGQYVSAPLDQELAEHGGRSSARRNGIDKLSPREFELLRHLGEGMTLQEAASSMGVVESTASTYRTRLMTKLGLQSTNQIIRYAIENGVAG